jgi:hypothetical protein
VPGTFFSFVTAPLRRAVVALLLGCLGATAACGDSFDRGFDRGPFDREVWIREAGSEARDNPRGGMAKAVVRMLETRRPTRDEVRRILGRPESGDGSAQYQYVLGMWSGFGVDLDFLHVYFTDDGAFARAAILQH